jgi:hypothetical protein
MQQLNCIPLDFILITIKRHTKFILIRSRKSLKFDTYFDCMS